MMHLERKDKVDISDQIGACTDFMPRTRNESIYDAITAAYRAEFAGLELFPTKDQAVVLHESLLRRLILQARRCT